MARDRKSQRYEKTDPVSVAAWFGSSSESVEGVIDWDLKSQTMTEAILGVLAAGNAIMFGVSMSGDAVSVTIYAGESKQRKWVSDSIELDDLMNAIWQRGHTRKVVPMTQPAGAAAD